MAEKITFGETINLTIKNVLPADEVYYSAVGKRTVMSLADAKDAGIVDFEYLLNAEGNFMKIVDGVAVDYAVDGSEEINAEDNVAVIARTSVRANDRYIQFFATQQKILLAPGDELALTVKTGAEAAHYLSLAVEGEITVDGPVA